jgi:hypothetical protein
MNKTTNIFLEIAKEDLKASSVLLKSKLYPQSVFYFGQAVEKTCKYLLVKDGILTVEKLKGTISHNTSKVFLIFTDYAIRQISEGIDIENINHNKGNEVIANVLNPIEFIEDLRTGIENFKKQNLNLRQLDEETFYHYLSLLRHFDSGQNSQNKYSKLFNAEPRALVEWLITCHILDETDKRKYLEIMQTESLKEQVLGEIERIQVSVFEFMRINQMLLVLALLFSSYDSVTRYPDLKVPSSPNMVFNEASPIILNLNELHKYLQKVISSFEP